MEAVIRSVDDLFGAFGGPTKVARLLGVGASTASEMKRRRHISIDHWPTLVTAAPEYGVVGLNYESLVLLHLSDKRRAAAA